MSRRYLRAIAMMIVLPVALVLTVSCRPRPTAEDSRRFAQVKQRYGNRYRFEFAEDTYLEATNTVDAAVNKNEAIAIYKDFWFTGETERRDSNYVYLNLYNRQGEFQYQVFWDRNSGRFVMSNRDHY